MSGAIAFGLANWRWLLPLVLLASLAIDDGYHRIALANCHEARAADKVAAEKARSEAIAHAQATSDRIITEQAQALAVTAAKVGGITERILHVPISTACASSPAMRAAVDGVRDLFRPGGGASDAGGGPAPAVPGSGPRRQP